MFPYLWQISVFYWIVNNENATAINEIIIFNLENFNKAFGHAVINRVGLVSMVSGALSSTNLCCQRRGNQS